MNVRPAHRSLPSRRGSLAMLLAGPLAAQEIARHTHTAPRIIRRTEPEYTPEALAAKLEGVVVLTSVVGADGVASEIKVVRGLGVGLDEKAIECLKKWRFKPGEVDGEPAPTKVNVEMNFRLTNRIRPLGK